MSAAARSASMSGWGRGRAGMSPRTRFTLPEGAEATAPAEHRGVRRDGVRQLVATPQGVRHATFHDLPGQLEPGDLVVVNTSATLPAAVDGTRADGRSTPVHVASRLDDGDWVVELRLPDGTGPDLDLAPGESLELPGRIRLKLIWPYPDPDALTSRLWRAEVVPQAEHSAYLARFGRPITYRYLNGRFPLDDYQQVYATEPGSAEMASAGRPFTAELIVRLIARGVAVAPVVLHAGVSSPELHEPPMPERFSVPAATARQVNAVRVAGNRVVAVGTTVVRALETAASEDGTVGPAAGWTDVVLGPDRPARVVNGLVTGLHEPESSHLLLLEAVAGADLVAAAYAEVAQGGYLWHEFGDSMLVLP